MYSLCTALYKLLIEAALISTELPWVVSNLALHLPNTAQLCPMTSAQTLLFRTFQVFIHVLQKAVEGGGEGRAALIKAALIESRSN